MKHLQSFHEAMLGVKAAILSDNSNNNNNNNNSNNVHNRSINVQETYLLTCTGGTKTSYDHCKRGLL